MVFSLEELIDTLWNVNRVLYDGHGEISEN